MDSNASASLAVVSVIISSVAIGLVVASLSLQHRQLRASHLQTERLLHVELVRLGIEYPEIIVDPNRPLYRDSESVRKYSFVNLNFVLLWLMFSSPGGYSESALRLTLKSLFSAETTRSWWAEASGNYRAFGVGRRHRRFIAITDDEYQRSLRRKSAEE